MRTVVDCVSSFIPLLSTEYEIVLGRKNVAVKLIRIFIIKFISKVSDSEQTKRAVLNKTRTALNVIL
mgnify:CR=1 FL=1